MNGSHAKLLRRFAKYTYNQQIKQGTLKNPPPSGSKAEEQAIRTGYQRLKNWYSGFDHIQKGVMRYRLERLLSNG